MYFWSAFGGSVPLRPKGYRVLVPLKSALILPTNAPVRISGVDVGTITGRRSLPGGRWLIEIEIDSRYAPLPSNVRALARAKTFFGETYLELTPGTASAPPLPEGGRRPWARGRAPVELDEVFYAFDRRTREALRTWFAEQATSIDGRGRDLGDAFGTLDPWERDVTALLTSLRVQDHAVRRVVADTGAVFDALSLRGDALRGLVVNGRRATDTLAARSDAIAGTVRALPAFERESAVTVRRLTGFARATDPLVRALRPAARELSPLLRAAGALAPELRSLTAAQLGADRASVRGLPALAEFIDGVGGLVREFPPFTRELNPIIRAIDAFRDELGGVLANWTAATQSSGPGATGKFVKYMRITTPLNPEGLSLYAQRLGSNRTNPYASEGIAQDLARRYDVFDARACGRGVVPVLSSTGTDYLARVWRYAVGGEHGTVAVPCLQARPRGPDRYPHVGPDPG